MLKAQQQNYQPNKYIDRQIIDIYVCFLLKLPRNNTVAQRAFGVKLCELGLESEIQITLCTIK